MAEIVLNLTPEFRTMISRLVRDTGLVSHIAIGQSAWPTNSEGITNGMLKHETWRFPATSQWTEEGIDGSEALHTTFVIGPREGGGFWSEIGIYAGSDSELLLDELDTIGNWTSNGTLAVATDPTYPVVSGSGALMVTNPSFNALKYLNTVDPLYSGDWSNYDYLRFWVQYRESLTSVGTVHPDDYLVRIGNDDANYFEWTMPWDAEWATYAWNQARLAFADAAIVGSPDRTQPIGFMVIRPEPTPFNGYHFFDRITLWSHGGILLGYTKLDPVTEKGYTEARTAHAVTIFDADIT